MSARMPPDIPRIATTTEIVNLAIDLKKDTATFKTLPSNVQKSINQIIANSLLTTSSSETEKALKGLGEEGMSICSGLILLG